MRIRVSSLRRLISEAIEEGFIQLPEDEMRQVISKMDPDQVATKEYVDADTGEVYLSPGEKARSSSLHPQGRIDRDERAAAKKASDEARWAQEDAESAAYDAEQEKASRDDDQHAAHCRAQFDEALDEFVSNWEDDPNLEPGIEHDAAETFFDAYPEADDWGDAMGMSHESMLSAVMDRLAR